MRNTCIAFTVVLSACFTGSGCTYIQNRGNDLIDILGLGGGIGIGASMRATHYVQGGLMGTGPRVRMQGREVYAPVGFCGEFGLAPIFHFRAANAGAEEAARTIILARTLTDAKQDLMWQRWYDSRYWSFLPDWKAYQTGYDRRMWDIGISAYALIGVDIDFNPFELVDFLLGWFTVDLAGDDDTGEVEQAAPVST